MNARTRRGFTMHEHLDSTGLIHMNGRVYDPSIGRFLSADPFVQDAFKTQSFNRYSYVLNNPLSMTDPSGFFWDSWDWDWDWEFWDWANDDNDDNDGYSCSPADSWLCQNPRIIDCAIRRQGCSEDPANDPGVPHSPPPTSERETERDEIAPVGAAAGISAGGGAVSTVGGASSWWRSTLDWLGTPLTDPFPRYVHLPYGGVLYSPDGREITWDEPLTRGELIGSAAGTLGAFGTLPRAASVLTRGATAASSTAFRILEQEGNVIIGSFHGAAGEARVITELVRQGDTLILRGTHIEGAGTLREALNVARQFGRDQGVKRVIIEGGRRSTGANPGHIPRPITVETGL